MPLRAGHELHEPAGPGEETAWRRTRFDLDDRMTSRSPHVARHTVPRAAPPSGPTARISRSALKRPADTSVAVRPVRQKTVRPPHMPIDGHGLRRQRIRRLS
ncbi:MAG: hypothetical protein ACLR7Z_01005 [Bilophila wadsworthia]